MDIIKMKEIECEVNNCKKCNNVCKDIIDNKCYIQFAGTKNYMSNVMVIGQSPAHKECKCLIGKIRNNTEFYSKLISKSKIGTFFNKLGLDIDEMYFTNLVKCSTIDNKIHIDNVKKCSTYLFEQINEIRPRIIIILGYITMCDFVYVYKLFNKDKITIKKHQIGEIEYQTMIINNIQFLCIKYPSYLIKLNELNEFIKIFKTTKIYEQINEVLVD